MKVIAIAIVTLGLIFVIGSSAPGIDKVKLASAIKVTPPYYLPVMAGEEKGFWKENGLEVEWVPFASGIDMQRAVMAGVIFIGLDSATAQLMGMSRGIPTIIVSDLHTTEGVALFVLGQSPLKEPKDLKGKKIGVAALGSIPHAMGLMGLKAQGLSDKEVRFVGVGSPLAMVAALKTEAVDGVVTLRFAIVDLWVKKEIRALIPIEDYLPKEWMDRLLFAQRDFARKNPDTVKRVVRAALQGAEYASKNPAWALEKLRSFQGYSEEGARAAHALVRFSKDGKINRQALENVKNFLIEYGIVPKEKMPAVEAAYTTEFTGQ